MSGAMPIPAREENCAEKVRLLHEYQVAADNYSRAVMVLSRRSGVMSKDDYTRIRDYSEVARTQAEAARACD
jgi:hypothetical protein